MKIYIDGALKGTHSYTGASTNSNYNTIGHPLMLAVRLMPLSTKSLFSAEPLPLRRWLLSIMQAVREYAI